jgi:CRISPR/Cas system-associated exonuclease Cas4 (RecB family)
LVQLLDYGSEEEKVRVFLERFPEHQKTLRLALVHEESGEGEVNYRGWQWSDVEVHPTKLMRLVIEGISKVNVKTRHSTHYLLRERNAVKKALRSPVQL